MDWALLGLEIVAIMTFCSLLDWFTSRKEQIASKDMIVGWYVRLGEFNYRQSTKQSIAFCNRLFDRIYSKRHFSWRCILVSYVISLTSVCLVASFTEIYQRKIVETISDKSQPQSTSNLPAIDLEGRDEYLVPQLIIVLLILALTANPLADYVSLIETRYLLRFASKRRLRYLPLLLLFDVFLTFSVLMLVETTIIGTYSLISGQWTDFSLDTILYDLKKGCELFFRTLLCWPTSSFNTNALQALRPIVWSTFSTSIIFYIYCLSALAFKLLGLAKTRLMILLQRLEESDKLFKGIGAFISACLVLFKAIVAIVQHIGQGF